MSLLFQDGFDSYTATADFLTSKRYQSNASSVAWASTSGRFGGGCLSAGSGISAINGLISSAFTSTTSATNYAGHLWMKIAAKPSTDTFFCQVYNSIQSQSLGIGIDSSTGFICMGNNSINRNISTVNVCDNQWHLIEWFISFNSGQAFNTSFAIDGGTASAVTAISFIVNNMNQQYVSFHNTAGGQTILIDDCIIYDNQAGPTGDISSATNYPIGPKRIRTAYPTANGTNAGWTPSAGSNFQNIDEVPPNGDTDYNSASVSTTRDSFTYGSGTIVPAGETPQWAVLNTYIKNNDPGSVNFQALTYNGSFGLGTSKVCPAAYNNFQQVFPKDPSGNAWTQSTVNSAEYGYGIV